MHCSNNFKQWGLALHAYHDAVQAFPASISNTYSDTRKNADGTAVDTDCWSASFKLLPYMEQQSRYAAIVSRVPWVWEGNSIPEMAGKIPPLLCPSDGSSQSPGLNSGCRSSIVVSCGDGMDSNRANPRDLVAPWEGCNITNHGFFVPYVYKSMASITDGTSNTVAASETVSNPLTANGYRGIKGGVYPVRPASASDCNITARSTTARNELAADSSGSYRGHWFTDGRPVTGQFNTIMPPNGPCCSDGAGDGGWALVAASSNHSGGVNVLRGDASVTFVSETIGTKLNGNDTAAVPTQTPSGRSPYGIWGELGTPNGGEATPFP
ncbi:MAG: DUF1559 domain-containing protein [Planctomycetaceae bacterium]|jgi:hypothetical protein|nr:DUF1559 domain-containing protein [Planctomycetaceae bacterium]